MKFELVTIFPDFFRGPLDYGIVRRAREAGLIEIAVHDLRVFTADRHKTVDDRPFGGGEGMVMMPGPIFECVESLGMAPREQRMSKTEVRETVILLSPQGRLFNQGMARQLAQMERIVLLCGRYEGVDERVAADLADQEVSIGDYVLSGGELAAAIIVDAATRLIPGALGNEASAHQESFTEAQKAAKEGPDSTCSSGGLLDYPHYTRPAEFRGLGVPEVLMGGNHEQIRRWRRQEALRKTWRNRPDLLEKQPLSAEDKKFLAGLAREKDFKF
ncbi:MAG TPA: tRNA (guanosine(37)-N1)-methyltransferase TrmD [Candidatus Saccharimonadales bacterium]|nr:tRNA (guanosine(37)-N1)-methyltransferase TrmD [Candidatus Saccharimonadales bacterium]